MTIDQNMMRSRHTHLNRAVVTRELLQDFTPTARRFAALSLALAAFAFGIGAF